MNYRGHVLRVLEREENFSRGKVKAILKEEFTVTIDPLFAAILLVHGTAPRQEANGWSMSTTPEESQESWQRRNDYATEVAKFVYKFAARPEAPLTAAFSKVVARQYVFWCDDRRGDVRMPLYGTTPAMKKFKLAGGGAEPDRRAQETLRRRRKRK